MDDALLVRGLERLGDLACNGEGLGDRQRSALETIGERRAFDQLEDQRGHAIGFFQSVDRADVRVIERGEQARFAREAGAAFGIGGKLGGRILMATSRPSLLSRAR